MNTAAPHGNIPNYMIWSILGTIASVVLCCFNCISILGLGTGIVAIVFSNKVNTLQQQGDIEGARRASNNAKIWNLVTGGILVLSIIIFVVLLMTIGMSGYMEQVELLRERMEQR